MRSALLILGTVVLLGGSFFFYWRMQPPTPVIAAPPRSTLLPPTTRTTHGGQGLWPGRDTWLVQFDQKTGQLSSRFRAGEFFPRPNGNVHVVSPMAEFFLSNHQRLHVEGIDGDVVMARTPDVSKGFLNSGSAGPPKRGRLNQVTMWLFDDDVPPGTPPDKHPVLLTVVTNNIAFDNETFRITTEGFTAPSGQAIAADQVPVKMTGEYEFDGRGLSVVWNDRDGRLELLEIAHGEKLTINNPKGFGPGGARKAPSTAPATGPADIATQAPLGPAIAQAPPADAPAPSAAAAPSTRSPHAHGRGGDGPESNRTTYLATFNDNVRVTQGEQTFITLDLMRIHFLLKNEGSGQEPATRPAASQPSTPGAALPAPETTSPVSGDVEATLPASRPAQVAATRPATQPVSEPVVITWTGKLRVAPIQSPPPRVLQPGEATVELIGTRAPVLVHRGGVGQQQGSEVHCASLLYQTSDGSVWLARSDRFPKVLLDRLPAPVAGGAAQGGAAAGIAEVVTDYLDYHAGQHQAILRGEGHATIPLAPTTRPAVAAAGHPVPATGPAVARRMDARWKREAKLYFAAKSAGHAQDDMTIERATFAGDVDVIHPQLALHSQALELAFGTAPTTRPAAATDSAAPLPGGPATAPAVKSTQPDLTRLVASDQVYCRLTDAADKQQTIECRRLELLTARSGENKLYPHEVYASGAVHAFDESQDLRAGRVNLTLRPSHKSSAQTQPATADAGQVDTSAVELDHMVARENVIVLGRDGATATAEELRVDMVGDEPHVLLTGPTLARVSDAKHNLITGPTITVERQKAHIVGPGTLHMVRAAEPGEKAGRPTDVIWSDRADLNGTADRIDVYGKVVATMLGDNGTMNAAHGEHVKIDLQKRITPTTKPAGTDPQRGPSASAAEGSRGAHPSALAATRARPGPATAPTTRPNGVGGAMQIDQFKDKEASAITLEDGAVVTSTLAAANGDILRQIELKGPTIRYALVATQDLPAGSLLVPAAGQMLVRDHRPPNVDAAKKEDPGDGLGTGRGATAFQWSRRLIYSGDTRRAVMTGDVLMVHEGNETKEIPVRLNADEVTAFFERAVPDAAATKPATTRPAKDPTSFQLKSVTAQGHLSVTRGAQTLTGDRVDFDPKTHWMVVRGTERNRAVFDDPAGNGSTSADEIWWNTQTWHIRSRNLSSKSVR